MNGDVQKDSDPHIDQKHRTLYIFYPQNNTFEPIIIVQSDDHDAGQEKFSENSNEQNGIFKTNSINVEDKANVSIAMPGQSQQIFHCEIATECERVSVMKKSVPHDSQNLKICEKKENFARNLDKSKHYLNDHLNNEGVSA